MDDVIVIGAGPAGSQAAFGLASQGYRVTVLEKKESLETPVCCTGIIGQECVNLFAIDHSVILRWLNSATFFLPSFEQLTVRRSESQACVVDRSAFNVALANRASAQGADYQLGSVVRGITVNRDRVRVEMDGNEDFLEARAAIVAAGPASKLVSALENSKAGDVVNGVQAEVETKGVEEVEVYLGREIAPGFFAWLVPTTPGKALAGLICRDKPGYYFTRLLAFLLAQRKIVSDAVVPSYNLLPLRPLSRTYADRLLVTGSAAGQVKPTTGGGIFYGLLGADLAVGSLHRALKADDLSARNLAGYQRAWKKKLGREIKTGYLARKLYESLSDAQVDRIFGIMKSNEIIKALEQAEDLSFDWHGAVILKLIGHRLLSKALGSAKISLFPMGGVKKY